MKIKSHRERIEAALNFEQVDRVPYSIWPHYPGKDFNPYDLAVAQVKDAVDYDFDFIKVTGIGIYSVLDFGTKYKVVDGVPQVDKYGTLNISEYGVKELNDWKRLKPIDVKEGSYGLQLNSIKHMKKLKNELGEPDFPIIATIFSPLTSAYKLAGNRLLTDIKTNGLVIHNALKLLTDTTIQFIKECEKIGVAGFFFSSQLSNKQMLTEDEYKEFGYPYDIELFNNMSKSSYFRVVHIHGENAMFDLLKNYPSNCLNWHDRWVGPSLEEVRKISDKCFLGGLDEEHVIGIADDEELKKHVNQAFDMGGSRGFILGPGCTAYPNAPRSQFKLIQKIIQERV